MFILLPFNFASEYAIRKDQAKWTGWNWVHQLLLHGENLLGKIIDTEKENTEASSDTTKENGLEINAEKTKYMSMHCEQSSVCQIQTSVYSWQTFWAITL